MIVLSNRCSCHLREHDRLKAFDRHVLGCARCTEAADDPTIGNCPIGVQLLTPPRRRPRGKR